MLIKTLAFGLLAICIAGVMTGLGLFRAHLENAEVRDRIIATEHRTIDLRPTVYAGLPDPVRRYFDYAFRGQTAITLRGVQWDQSGDFLLPVVGRFHADGHQVNRPASPEYAFTGWFWRMGLPLIESRDAFVSGTHDMRAKLLGWFKVMHTDYEEPEQIRSLHSYLLLRYYGQAPLMPWALLPNAFVVWDANDDTSAYLSLTVEGLAGRYLVTFAPDGAIASMTGDRLLMEGNGTLQREVGLKQDYREINGFMIPTRLDYRWYLENGTLTSHFASRIDNHRILR